MFEGLIRFVRDQYRSNDFIPLHAPLFLGNERSFVSETIDSTFVSSAGAFVDRFELEIAAYTNSPRAVATVNGTAALHMALILSGVGRGDIVLTQPLTFVAATNAISYCGAHPVFLDVDLRTLGLSPNAMESWLVENARPDGDGTRRVKAGGSECVRACMPMHTFGHPADLDGLSVVCRRWNIVLVEDASEAMGSFYKGRHAGTIGLLGVLSFNGNKIITTGGGGMILTNEEIAPPCQTS